MSDMSKDSAGPENTAVFSADQTPSSFASSDEKFVVELTLQTPEILEAILEKLDTRNLLLCRRVARNFNFEANKLLKSQTKIRQLKSRKMLCRFEDMLASSSEHISLPIVHLEFCNIRKLGTFATSLNSVKHHVKVVEWFLDTNWNSVEDMAQLLYNCLSNLAELRIEFWMEARVGSDLPDFAGKALQYSNKILPELKHISITIGLVESLEAQRNVCPIFKMLLASSVNLKSLALRTWGIIYRSTVQDISSITSSKIEEIELANWWAFGAHLTALTNYYLHFPLRILKLDCDISEDRLKLLLKGFCGSLVELHLNISKVFVYHNFPYAHMKKLRTLKLAGAGDHIWIEWSMLPQLSRLELNSCFLNRIATSMLTGSSHVPHLETLHMDDLRLLSDSHPALDQIISHVHSQLTSLKLLVWETWTSPLPLTLIFKECSRLKTLSLMSIDSSFEQQLCGVEQLETFSVNWPEDGIDAAASRDIAYSKVVSQAKELQHSVPNFRQSPFLGDLQDLQILNLFGNFSELAVLHGVVHCRTMRKITLISGKMIENRALGVIRHGGLVHLTSVELNDQFVSHLP